LEKTVLNIGETLLIKKIYTSSNSENKDKGILISNKELDWLFLISPKEQKASIKYFSKIKDKNIRVAIENYILDSLID